MPVIEMADKGNLYFGGGFMVFYARRDKQDAVRRAMENLMCILFEFENGVLRLFIIDRRLMCLKINQENLRI